MSLHVLKQGFILTIGNVVGGLLSYAFMILAARGLGPKDFGALGALLAIFYVVSLPLDGAIGTLLVQRITERRMDSETDPMVTVRNALYVVARYSPFVLIVYIAVLPFLKKVLKLEDYSGLLVLGVCGIGFAVYSVFRGALQGLERFSLLAALISGEAAMRLVLLFALTVPGLSVANTLATYVTGYLLATVVGAHRIQFNWRSLFVTNSRDQNTALSRHAWLTAVAFCVTSLLMQIDMVAAKHYLHEDVAGYYAAACSLIKTPFRLVTFAFSAAMFPSVVAAGAHTRRALKQLVTATFASLLAMAVGAVACFALASTIVALALGPEFSPLANWLGLFATAAMAPSLLFLIARFFIALDTRVLLMALLSGVVFETISLLVFHNSVLHIMIGMTIGNIVPVAALFSYAIIKNIIRPH